MTDHTIPFTAPMIRALLDGRKTQTRRPIKPSNSLFNGGRWTALHKAQTWDWNAAWVDPGPAAWDANPWVWAYSFTVAKRNIDAGASE